MPDTPDIGPARHTDPDSSRDAGEQVDTEAGREKCWNLVCGILDGLYPIALVNIGEGLLVLLTGKIVEKLNGSNVRGNTDRRFSDLKCQNEKGAPEVHFDLLERILGPNGKPLRFDGAEIFRLTPKGKRWKDHPEDCDWRWPHLWIDLILPEDLF